MSKKTNLDELVLLSEAELDQRLAAALGRAEDRNWRAIVENRDATSREQDLTQQDAQECSAIKDALELKAARRDQLAEMDVARQVAERSAMIQQAIETRGGAGRLSPLAISPGNLEVLEMARRRFESLSVIEERAALSTTLMGTAVEYAAGGLAAPNTLWRLSGIPTMEPPAGVKGTVPKVSLPAAAALVSEGNPHAEFDDVTPDPVTLQRTGAWSDLTAEAFIPTTLAEISGAHARIIAPQGDHRQAGTNPVRGVRRH